MGYDLEIEFARRVAQMAGSNAVTIRKGGITAEAKPDDSPVTIADRENERLVRAEIEREFPLDAILGEEGSSKPGASGRRWIIDPIDGTRDFVRGNRFWCVLIALEQDGEPVLGVVHFPLLDETYWAARGHGSFRNGERLHVSNVTDLSAAVVCPNGLMLAAARPYLPAVNELMQRSWAFRAYGGAVDACLLAAGQVDAWYEPKAEIWDLAPMRVLIEEAGGRFFALDGSDRVDAKNAIGCTPGIEAELRKLFGVPAR